MKIGETSEEYLNLTKLFDPEDMEDFVSGSLRMYLKVTGEHIEATRQNITIIFCMYKNMYYLNKSFRNMRLSESLHLHLVSQLYT
ncbi:hypothetical protein DPMN_178346 [Dreissena polymorpha]|uniref:Uncharacterized protein n=1 Tax=Dreissena polymorpha TaxID=45954 RepID=A0A9D4EF11_DREPO|nr:hypothetical protein DPMN_178346 [Dreissena polymorpha]